MWAASLIVCMCWNSSDIAFSVPYLYILNGCSCSNKTASSSVHVISIFWIRTILFRCLKVQLRGNIANVLLLTLYARFVADNYMSLLWQIVCVSHGTITKSILRGLLMISPRHFIFLRHRWTFALKMFQEDQKLRKAEEL